MLEELLDDRYRCRCGTGLYCNRHKKYGRIRRQRKRCYRDAGEDVTAFQRCGGGLRLIKKRIGD